MVDAITGLDEKLTDIRVRLGRLEERSVHTESRADRTNTEIGEVKAMITEMRKDFDRELAAMKAMISCMQESFNEKIAKVRINVARNAGITGLVVSAIFFLFKKFF